MKMYRIVYLILLFFQLNSFSQDIFLIKTNDISFTSDAPLELIEAGSQKMQGVLKISDRSFAFRIPMNSFKGFNSSMQQTHFNDNYLETGKFPNTTFSGKIIEDIDFNKPGTYSVRGKGSFNCHGVKQERIIKCKITIKPDVIKISSEFTVLLDDHDIKIPSVVSQKIAEEILVNIDLELIPQK